MSYQIIYKDFILILNINLDSHRNVARIFLGGIDNLITNWNNVLLNTVHVVNILWVTQYCLMMGRQLKEKAVR